LLDDRREKSRGDGEIEKPVALGVVLHVDFADLLLQAFEGFSIAEISLDVVDALGEPRPGFRIDVRVLWNLVAKFLAERFRGFIVPREANDGEAFGKLVVLGEIAESGNEFAFGEVAGGAEDHHYAGRGFGVSVEMVHGLFKNSFCAERELHVPSACCEPQLRTRQPPRGRPLHCLPAAIRPRCGNQCFFSMCPPNWKRIADKILKAKSASPRDENRS